jgi:hypothetical protein
MLGVVVVTWSSKWMLLTQASNRCCMGSKGVPDHFDGGIQVAVRVRDAGFLSFE